MYGRYLRVAYKQERVMMEHIQYLNLRQLKAKLELELRILLKFWVLLAPKGGCVY